MERTSKSHEKVSEMTVRTNSGSGRGRLEREGGGLFAMGGFVSSTNRWQ